MKEVTKKEQPEVSGGEFHQESCIPYPNLPGKEGDFGRERINPVEQTIVPEA